MLWSEEEGGHGLMFLPNRHPQANSRETHDLFEHT